MFYSQFLKELILIKWYTDLDLYTSIFKDQTYTTGILHFV